MITPVAINNIGYQYYIVYATIAACIPITVYFLFPETMGRNLEDIDLLFKDSPSVWSTVKFAKSRPVGNPRDFTTDKEKDGNAEYSEEKTSTSTTT